MLFQISYKIKSTIHSFDSWDIEVDGIKVAFIFDNGRVTGLRFSTPITDAALLPSIRLTPTEKVRAHITTPLNPDHDRITGFARRVHTFLNFFSFTEFDFDSEKIEWIPETDEERKTLDLFGYETGFVTNDKPVELTFDFVAALAFHAYKAHTEEIPLSFVDKANRFYAERSYINAFYNYFFYIETKFFPGYSDPKVIKKKILSNKVLADEIKLYLESADCSNVLKTQEHVVNRLLRTRGSLHHHSPKGPASWHPDKPEIFKEDVEILRFITNNVAQSSLLSMVYSEEERTNFLQSCRDAGSVFEVKAVFVEELSAGVAEIERINATIPAMSPHFRMLSKINYELRQEAFPISNRVASYTFYDSNENKLAEYKSYLSS